MRSQLEKLNLHTSITTSLTAFALCVFVLFPKHAAAEISVGLFLGKANSNLDASLFADTDIEINDAELGLSMHYAMNYYNDSGWLVEASVFSASSGSAFPFLGAVDYSTLTELRLMGGYRFPIGERSYFIPKIGISRWDLTTEEGALFNPGPEDIKEFDGTDLAIQLELNRRIGLNRSFLSRASASFGISFTNMDPITNTTFYTGMSLHF